MTRVRRFALAAALSLAALSAHATQLLGPTFCYPLGEWDTTANLNSDRPPASYPCAQASTEDNGPMWDNGSGWVTFYSVVAPSVSAAITSAVSAIPPAPLPAIGAPNARSLSMSTAYQASTSSSPAFVTVNLSSTASLTISGGTTNTAEVVFGSTNGVASGTGTIIPYTNSQTGTIVVGIAVSTTSTQSITFALPANWYFAVLTTSGTVTISSAFDQALT